MHSTGERLPAAQSAALADSGASAQAAPASVEEEVLENVRRQPIGDHTVGDLGLPDAFLRRVADRVIRASYEQRYRIVVEETTTSRDGANATRSMSESGLHSTQGAHATSSGSETEVPRADRSATRSEDGAPRTAATTSSSARPVSESGPRANSVTAYVAWIALALALAWMLWAVRRRRTRA